MEYYHTLFVMSYDTLYFMPWLVATSFISSIDMLKSVLFSPRLQQLPNNTNGRTNPCGPCGLVCREHGHLKTKLLFAIILYIYDEEESMIYDDTNYEHIYIESNRLRQRNSSVFIPTNLHSH